MRAQYTSKSHGAAVPRVCEHCGTAFVTFQSEVDRGGARHCSHACYAAHRVGRNLVPFAVRFWAKVAKSEGCWLWTAGVDTHGYGQIRRDANHIVLASRAAWELCVGPIPIGLEALHHCDTPRCVRADPDPTVSHLFLGTTLENCRDTANKGRTTWGERSTHAKLTEAQVIEIRRRYANTGETVTVLGKAFGVAQCTVSQIVHRRIWTHIPSTE